MAKIVFRFDIDSHKCIRDGVPILLRVAAHYGIRFTFYVNVGKAISRLDTLCSLCAKRRSEEENIKMLSAKQKLGIKDYFYAAMVNPSLDRYRENIRAIAQSGSELGLHGGMNHSHWYTHALHWSYEQVKKDLKGALDKMQRVLPDYIPQGFAAPGFVTNDVIGQALQDMGFQYLSNWHENHAAVIRKECGGIPDVGVNLCGEPGGVAFWEYAAASEWTDQQTLEVFMDMVNTHDEVVVFDHPYFVALQKVKSLEIVIETLLKEGHQIITLRELALER